MIPRHSDSTVVPRQAIVRFSDGITVRGRGAILADHGAATIKPLALPRLQLVRLPPGISVASGVEALERTPGVASAEPNYVVHALATPNDTRFDALWGMRMIAAPAAWEIATGSRAVTVAVVDTGIATDHLDLGANVVPGYDFVDDDSDPRDFEGHGTIVAGTIGALGNNGRGVTGVNWATSLMPVRVLDGDGNGTDADVIDGFAYACSHGASIVNASLGGEGYSDAMATAIAACPNTLFVFAAGNESVDNGSVPTYPCNFGASAPDPDLPNVICVAATDEADQLADFSNYGSDAVDLAAPGVDVESTSPAYDTLFSDGFEAPIPGAWLPSIVSGTDAFDRSPNHVGGAFSATDSPAGDYQNDTETSLAHPASVADLRGKIGCRLFYDLLLDTEPDADFFEVRGSADDLNFVGDGWSGSTDDEFVPFSSDMSEFDGSSTFYPGLRFVSDSAVTGDGGYLDDLSLGCLKPEAEAYDSMTGTSIATPYVAGVAALVKSLHPAYGVAELKAAILNNVDPLPSLAGVVASGGRLDACRALAGCGGSAPSPPPPAVPPAPPPPPAPLVPPPVAPTCVVPVLAGLKLADAQPRLAESNCSLGAVVPAYSKTVAKGRIVSQGSRPGMQLVYSAPVDVVVSKGAAPSKKAARVVMCRKGKTILVRRAQVRQLRKHGAKLGACRRWRHR